MEQKRHTAKILEALLAGYEIHQKDRIILITEDKRAGYEEGELFYEQTFPGFIGIIESLTEEDFIGAVAFLGLNK